MVGRAAGRRMAHVHRRPAHRGVESPMIRKAAFSFLLCGAIGLAFVAGSWHSRQDTVSASGLHGRRILYYVDPMHPSYKSDKPGIAPDCNMTLEPVYADGDAPPDVTPVAGAIALDAAKQQM